MHHSRLVCISAAMMVLESVSAGADQATTPLQPPQPVSGSALQIYVKVRSQNIAEYCKAEGLGVPRCNPGKLFEAKDACAAPYKVAAVSCGLSDLGAEPRLVVATPDTAQATGACVWAFDKLAADKVPLATTTLLCIK